MKYFAALMFTLFCFAGTGFAQDIVPNKIQKGTANSNFFNTRMDYQVRAFFNIGGTAPLGLPREIRKVNSYNPRLQLGLGAYFTKWFKAEQWGIRAGVEIESKGMETRAGVKNYLTEIQNEGASVRGYFTGSVKTKVNNTYVSIPVLVVYKLSPRWNLYGGFYGAMLIDKEFNGTVTDGHFKQGDPTGTQLNFEDGSSAPYDFKTEQRFFQWGTKMGAEWSLNNKHFKLFPELNYDINGLFHSGFDSISFSMHNIYLSLGFGYQF